MNYQIVLSNIEEALEELERIRDKVNSKNIDDVEFKIALQHVYHHLNFSWNVRNQKTEKYENLTDDEFIKWGKYPLDLDLDE